MNKVFNPKSITLPHNFNPTIIPFLYLQSQQLTFPTPSAPFTIPSSTLTVLTSPNSFNAISYAHLPSSSPNRPHTPHSIATYASAVNLL